MSNKSYWQKNKVNIMIYAGVFLAFGVLTTTVLFASKKNKEGENGLAGSDEDDSSGGSGFCKHGDNFPLKYGSCGKKVKEFQKLLLLKGADLGKAGIDGKYGSKTEKAAKKHFKKSIVSLPFAKSLNIA